MDNSIEMVDNSCRNFPPSEIFTNDKTVTIFADREMIQYSVFLGCVVETLVNQRPVFFLDDKQDYPKWFFQNFVKADLFFLFMGVENFSKFAIGLKNHALWNARSRVLVYAENEQMGLERVRILWKTTWAVNVSVVVIKEDVRFHFWTPYEENSCGNVEKLAMSLGEIFPVKLSRNLHQCPIRVVFSWIVPYVINEKSGIEPEIMLAVSQALNLSYEPIELFGNFTAWQHSDENGQPVGIMRMLLEHEVDVAMSHFLRTWLGNQIVDMPVAHSEAGLFWYVPYPAPVSRANNIFKAFSVETWIVFGAALIGVMLVAFLDHPRDGILDAMALVLNQPLTKPTSRLFAYFVVIVSWYSLHTSTAFQSSLIVFLSAITRERPLETFQDLAESDLKFLYVKGTDVMYNQSQHDLWDVILKRVTFTPFTDMTRVTASRDHFTVAPKSVVDFTMQGDEFYDAYGFPLFRPLAEPFSSDYVVFYVSPGHPLLPEMDRITLWLFEAGLPKFWARRYAGRQRSKTLLIREPFGLVNLEGAFYILSAALVFSFIVFVSEFITIFLIK